MRSTCTATSCASAAARAAWFGLRQGRRRRESGGERLLVLAGRRARRPRAARTRAARRRGSRRPSARTPSPPASRARTARRGSADRRRRRPRATVGRLVGDGANDVHSGRPSSSPRSGPSPTKASDPSPWRAKARARRTTFFRSVSAPTQRNAVPSGRQPTSVRAVASSAGAKRSRSTPQSITVVLPDARERPPRAGAEANPTPRSPPQPAGRRAGSPPDDGRALGVRDVLSVRGQDDGRPSGERRRAGLPGRGSARRRRPARSAAPSG